MSCYLPSRIQPNQQYLRMLITSPQAAAYYLHYVSTTSLLTKGKSWKPDRDLTISKEYNCLEAPQLLSQKPPRCCAIAVCVAARGQFI